MRSELMSRRTTLALAATVAIVASGGARAQTAPAPARIGIVGAGNIGGTLGGLWAKAGHEVMVSSRHPEELRGLVESLGPK
ncbi:MAG: NADP oxidoreductase, partial [Methylobacterium sp.]